jgi:GNAT superfamily N-acetyltransferase
MATSTGEQTTDFSGPARLVEIRPVRDTQDLESVRTLMYEYGDYLAHLAETPLGAASICLAGYDEELAGLPKPYVAPGMLLLAFADGEPAGCVALKPLRPKGAVADGSALELKRLWVRPEFRGLRLGSRLMQAAIDHARATGAAAVYLDTVPAAMPEASRLYAAMGFRQIERYNDNQVADVVFLRLDLQAQVNR